MSRLGLWLGSAGFHRPRLGSLLLRRSVSWRAGGFLLRRGGRLHRIALRVLGPFLPTTGHLGTNRGRATRFALTVAAIATPAAAPTATAATFGLTHCAVCRGALGGLFALGRLFSGLTLLACLAFPKRFPGI